jgi:hypothetical protein
MGRRPSGRTRPHRPRPLPGACRRRLPPGVDSLWPPHPRRPAAAIDRPSSPWARGGAGSPLPRPPASVGYRQASARRWLSDNPVVGQIKTSQ